MMITTSIIDEYENQIVELEKKISKIQKACSHPEEAVEAVPHGSSGGWDQDDYYWYTKTCGLCKKVWNEEQ